MSFFDIFEGRHAAEVARAVSRAPTGGLISKLHNIPNVEPPRKPFYRLCLMSCENYGPDLHGKYGDWSDIFQAWLEKSLEGLPAGTVKFQMDTFDAPTQERPKDVSIYDAVLVSGSSADAYADIEWINNLVAFLQDIYKNHEKIRVYGICFGHQVVSRSLGATVQPNNGRWEIGLSHVATSYMGKLLFGSERLTLMLFHQDHVLLESLTPSFSSGDIYLLGQTLRTPNQGIVKFYPSDKHKPGSEELVHRVHIFTTQAHPELTEVVIADLATGFQKAGKIPPGTEIFPISGSNPEAHANKQPGDREMRYFDGVGVIGRTLWRILGVNFGDEEPPKVPILTMAL